MGAKEPEIDPAAASRRVNLEELSCAVCLTRVDAMCKEAYALVLDPDVNFFAKPSVFEDLKFVQKQMICPQPFDIPKPKMPKASEGFAFLSRQAAAVVKEQDATVRLQELRDVANVCAWHSCPLRDGTLIAREGRKPLSAKQKERRAKNRDKKQKKLSKENQKKEADLAKMAQARAKLKGRREKDSAKAVKRAATAIAREKRSAEKRAQAEAKKDAKTGKKLNSDTHSSGESWFDSDPMADSFGFEEKGEITEW